jgi:hypothetical protein
MNQSYTWILDFCLMNILHIYHKLIRALQKLFHVKLNKYLGLRNDVAVAVLDSGRT